MAATFVSTSSTPMPKPGEPSRDTQLRVGRLTKAHGLKGAIKVELYTDEPDKRFVPGAVFTLQVPEESPWFGKTLELAELRWYNEHPVAFFVGVPDRTAAESLIKAILWIDVEGETATEPDAWYDHQLVGLSVERDGLKVGKVIRVEHMPAQDLLVISTPKGDVMLPFVKALVPAVDLDKGIVTITPPGGLFEEIVDEDEPAEGSPVE
jgi:16S rRNA processing protein RimM